MSSRMKSLTKEADARKAQTGQRTQQLEGAVDTRRQEFDARDYMRESTGAAFDQFKESFGENIDSLRGQQVGRGRLDTGFAFEDEDMLFRNMGRDLNRQLGSMSMAAAGLDMRNTEGMAGDAAQAGAVYDSSVSGAMDRETAELNARDKKRQNRLGLLGAVAGGVGGFFLGGPAGIKLGAGLGSRLGDLA